LVGTVFVNQFIHSGREFIFLEYWTFFRPQHGIVLGIFSSKVYHDTRQNIGFIQVGVALTAKARVAFIGAKRQQNLQM